MTTKNSREELKGIEKELDRTTNINKIIKLSIKWFELKFAIDKNKIKVAWKIRKLQNSSNREYTNMRNPLKPELSTGESLKFYNINDMHFP